MIKCDFFLKFCDGLKLPMLMAGSWLAYITCMYVCLELRDDLSN